MIGVLLSKFLPPAVVTALLVMYLIYSTYKMFAKAVQTHRKETADRIIRAPPVGGGNFGQDPDSRVNLPGDYDIPHAKNLGMHLEVGELDSTLGELSTREMMKQQACNFF
jgi:hypothetical protein